MPERCMLAIEALHLPLLLLHGFASSKYVGGNTATEHSSAQPPTCLPAGYGREAAVQRLLQLGGDPSAAGDRSGMAALHRAAARNHAGTLGMLLAAGADCCQRSAAGQTPLHYASQFGHEPAVRLLLEHLAATEQQAGIASGGSGAVNSCSAPARTLAVHLALADAAGLAPLHLAAQWGMAGVAELLLEAGAGAVGVGVVTNFGCRRSLGGEGKLGKPRTAAEAAFGTRWIHLPGPSPTLHCLLPACRCQPAVGLRAAADAGASSGTLGACSGAAGAAAAWWRPAAAERCTGVDASG